MALPVIIAAGASITAILITIAKWIQAIAATATAVINGVIAWFTAHKIIFALFLAACYVALWALIMQLIFRVARWGAGIAVQRDPGFSTFVSYLSFFGDWVDFSAMRYCLGVASGMFAAEVLIRNSVFARRAVRNFLVGLSHTFHG